MFPTTKVGTGEKFGKLGTAILKAGSCEEGVGGRGIPTGSDCQAAERGCHRSLHFFRHF